MTVASVKVFPRDDAAFSAYVARALDAALSPTPQALEERIQAWYPRARVVERMDLAGYGGPLWYVYRDGHALADRAGPWWERPGAARIEFDSQGIGHDPSPEFCALVRLDASQIEGRPWSSFVGAPAAADDTAWLAETFQRDRSITSTAEVTRGDGTTAWIEFHLEPTADPDRFVSFCRELTPE